MNKKLFLAGFGFVLAIGVVVSAHFGGSFKLLGASIYEIPSKEKTVNLSTINVIPLKNIYLNTLKSGNQTVTGTIEVTHWDDFTHNVDIPMASIQTKTGLVSLNITQAQHDALLPISGETVSVSGNFDGSRLSITTPISQIESTATKHASPRSSGGQPHNLVVILYKFSNEATPPYSAEAVRENYFEANPNSEISMAQFLSDSTYGNIELNGKTSANGSTDVHGWYTVPDTRVSCNANYDQASADAIAAAIADGVQINDNDFVAVGTYLNGCTIGGQATIFQLPDGGGAREVIMDDMLEWGNALHEFGHLSFKGSSLNVNDMINHSHSVDCTNSANADVPYGDSTQSQCNYVEYGSPFSVMGGFVSGAQEPRLLDAENRREAGYLDSSNYETATESGTYDLKKINYSTANILQIPINGKSLSVNGVSTQGGNEGTLSIETRDFLKYEQGTDTGSQENVVMINQVLDGDQSGVTENQNTKLLLSPGESTTIENQDVTISNLGGTPGDSTKVRVQVQYLTPNGKPFQPTASLTYSVSPLFYSTINNDGTFTNPTVTFTNNDSDRMEIQGETSSATQIYPIPIANTSLFSNGTSGLSSNFSIPASQKKSVSLFQGGIITPSLLTSSRWIYKTVTPFTLNVDAPIGESVGGNGSTYRMTTLFVHGTFTPAELANILNPLGLPTATNPTTTIIPIVKSVPTPQTNTVAAPKTISVPEIIPVAAKIPLFNQPTSATSIIRTLVSPSK